MTIEPEKTGPKPITSKVNSKQLIDATISTDWCPSVMPAIFNKEKPDNHRIKTGQCVLGKEAYMSDL